MDAPVVVGDVLLDKYRVERVLGQGGMGFVVAVRHVDLGQLYAMKFLLPTGLGNPEALERFLREAQAAALLRSDHAARVHDVGRMPNGAPYMIMEYLEGCDLKKYVERTGPLPVEEAVMFVLHACDAIAEAHAAGIIHRDLKPANLFLSKRRNGSLVVKVLDFGISKQTASDKVELTNSSTALGSPRYMSPEQIAKSKTVDTRTDVWALGLIAYELLAGECPFRAGSLLEVAAKVLQDEPADLREVRPDVPENVVAAIERCLRKRREDRWGSVEEFAAELGGFVMSTQAMRLSAPSVANEGNVMELATTVTPTIPVTSAMEPNPDPVTPAAGESTTISFSQTGKLAAMKLAHTQRLLISVILALMSIGFVVGLYLDLWFAPASTQENGPSESASADKNQIVVTANRASIPDLIRRTITAAKVVWPNQPNTTLPVRTVRRPERSVPVKNTGEKSRQSKKGGGSKSTTSGHASSINFKELPADDDRR